MKISDILEQLKNNNSRFIETPRYEITEVSSGNLLREVASMIDSLEMADDTETKDTYDRIINLWESRYGKLGCIYLMEFTDTCVDMLLKFRSVSKRNILMKAILKSTL